MNRSFFVERRGKRCAFPAFRLSYESPTLASQVGQLLSAEDAMVVNAVATVDVPFRTFMNGRHAEVPQMLTWFARYSRLSE